MRAILLGGGFALLISLLGTRVAIKQFTRLGYGQEIRDDGPTSHHTKRGTPTMGGVVIIGAAVVGYFAAKLITLTPPTASGLLLLFLLVGCGLVGFLDDFIKISKQRSLGLRSKAKMVGQTIIGVGFGALALSPWLEDEQGRTPASEKISFLREIDWLALPFVVAVLLILLIVTGASNAVNLADGLDGLATGASVMVFGAYMLVNIWQSGQSCESSPGPQCYDVRDPLDLAIIAAAITGACFGFLWWNASPAAIFMGDTGSLALGGALAGFAILTRTELLLLILGGLFVITTLSVIIQVGVFKASRASGLFRTVFRVKAGHRVFRIAPHPPPLRAARVGAGHRRDPLLDHHRPVRGHRARGLLRRVGRPAVTVDLSAFDRGSPWDGVRAVVLGFGVSGFAAADNLTHLGAQVHALADGATAAQLEKAELLEVLGARVDIHAGATQTLPDDVDLVVTSPGFRPDSALLVQAHARGVPVWGEVELAWRLRGPGPTGEPAPWLCITGTNGKTTTTQMLDSILRAAGLRSVAVGNVGLPIVEAVMDPAPYDVLAVELSSFQLHYTHSMSAQAAAVLNLAEDHLDWYSGDRPTPGRAWRSTPPTRAGSSSGPSGPASTTSPTPPPRRSCARRTSSRAPAPSGSPSACPASAWSAWSRTCSSTARSSRTAPRSAAELCSLADLAPEGAGDGGVPLPTWSPTPWPRRRSPAPTVSTRRPCRPA